MNKARLLLLVSIVVGLSALSLSIRFLGWQNTLAVWNIRDDKVPFLDLRMITGSAESYAHGYDPTLYNPGDPAGRVFNYPKIWYVLFGLGINQSWTLPIAVAMLSLFLASLLLFPGRLTVLSALFLLFALMSPAVILAFDRMNVEMLIFSLMSLSLLLTQDYAWAAVAVLFMAVLLKLVPVLGVGGVMGRERGQSVKLIFGAVVFTALYFAFTFQDMIYIFRSTPRGTDQAYGVAVLPSLLRQIVKYPLVRQSPVLFYGALNSLSGFFLRYPRAPYVAAVLIFLVFCSLGLRHAKPDGMGDLRNLRAFWMGAGMYIGTFFLGHNWDYRMIFLLFTLPQLADWVSGEKRGARAIAVAACAALFWSLWSWVIQGLMSAANPLAGYAFSLLDEVANWALFAALTYLFAASLPGWILRDLNAVWLRLVGHRQAASPPTTPAALPFCCDNERPSAAIGSVYS